MREQYRNELQKYGDDFLLGVITRVNRTNYDLLANNTLYHGILTGRFKYMVFEKSEYPAVGDYVIGRHIDDSNQVIIEKVCERYSKVSRIGRSKRSDEQVFASNVDLAFICMSLNEDFRVKKLRNFLSIINDSNIETIVLLTKSDLCDDREEYISQVKNITDSRIMIVNIYDDSITQINEILENKTGVFIGSSGVGKSSIVNKLLGENRLEVDDIRTTDDQGRHTTSHRELIQLENGGRIIDTPGIRMIHNFDFDENNDIFQEITTISKECRFNDCTHTEEPGCQVVEAIENGDLDYEAFEAYQRALRYQRFSERRNQERLRLQNKRKKG